MVDCQVNPFLSQLLSKYEHYFVYLSNFIIFSAMKSLLKLNANWADICNVCVHWTLLPGMKAYCRRTTVKNYHGFSCIPPAVPWNETNYQHFFTAPTLFLPLGNASKLFMSHGHADLQCLSGYLTAAHLTNCTSQ